MVMRSGERELPTGAVAKIAALSKVAESVDSLYPQIVAEMHIALGRLSYVKAKHTRERDALQRGVRAATERVQRACDAADAEAEALKVAIEKHRRIAVHELEMFGDEVSAAANAALEANAAQATALDALSLELSGAVDSASTKAELVAAHPALMRRLDAALARSAAVSDAERPRMPAADECVRARSARHRHGAPFCAPSRARV